jgi:cobalamin biosynthesis protein CobW
MMHTRARIPATVVTGFLGSGKTSLIRSLLQQADGRRIALIVNEFGDVGIDRELLLGCSDACADEDVVELANGCICCTVADDFLPTMRALLAREVDHVVIETSGLALPKPLIKAFGWPDVRTRVTVDGVVAVVDSPAVAAGQLTSDPVAVDAQRRADDSLDHESPLEELFEEQLGSADLVVLNKADQVADDAWPMIEARVREELRPGVRTVRARHAHLPIEVLIGLGAAAESDLDSRRSHHDDGDHEHDDFDSFHLDVPPLADVEGFAERLRGAARRHPILRAKGLLEVEGRPMRLVVQGVGDRLQHHFDRPWRPDEERAGRLVVIGERGLDRAAIQALLLG